MKKTILTGIAAVALGTISFALPVLAATTASITPANVTVTAGQQFNVVVAVNPNGTTDYAEQLQINYPAGFLQVASFNIGSGWMALTQTGYDSVDNVNGVLTKTGGYPNGISSLTPFGTITFTAVKSGSGAITIGNGSNAFQKSGQTAINGSSANFVVTAAAVAPVVAPKTPAPKVPSATDLTPVTTINGQVVATTTAQVAAAAMAASQASAAVANTSGGHGSIWVWVIIAIILVTIIVAYVAHKRKKSSL